MLGWSSESSSVIVCPRRERMIRCLTRPVASTTSLAGLPGGAPGAARKQRSQAGWASAADGELGDVALATTDTVRGRGQIVLVVEALPEVLEFDRLPGLQARFTQRDAFEADEVTGD